MSAVIECPGLDIHFHADIALASRPSCPPGRRAVSTLTDDLARYASRVLEGRALLAVVCYGALPVARAVRLRRPPQPWVPTCAFDGLHFD